MKQLLSDVIQRLSEASMPEDYSRPRGNNRLFEYVDLNWGQADFYAGFPPPIKFPAALVDVVGDDASTMGANAQIDIVQLEVRIIDMVLGNSSAQAPPEQRERAFAIFDLVRQTKALLHGWTAEGISQSPAGSPPAAGYGPLTHTGTKRISRRDGLREFQLLFRVQLSGYDAVNIPATAPVGIQMVKLNVGHK